MKNASKEQGPWLVLAASTGFAKRVTLSEFQPTTRGGTGKQAIKLTDAASVVSVHVVDGQADGVFECLVATKSGMLTKIALSEVPTYSRIARGVRMIRLKAADELTSLTPCKY